MPLVSEARSRASAVKSARQAAAEGYVDAQRLRVQAEVELLAADVALEKARQQAHETFIRKRAAQDNWFFRRQTAQARAWLRFWEETVETIDAFEYAVWGKWWAKDPSALGQNVETVTSFTPVVIIQSVSNLTYDLVHFKADGEHVKNIGADALGAIPVVGKFTKPLRFAKKAFGALKRSRLVSKVLSWSKRARRVEHAAEEAVSVAPISGARSITRTELPQHWWARVMG